ncbi:MAG: gamma-glutamyltransferase [Dichotomicrobium sp.]
MVKGVAAAGHPVTAQAATEVMADGGNAFDAACAAMMTACVCEPVLASPGGGGFLMAQHAGGNATLYDFFAQTPKRKRDAEAIEFTAIQADFGPATQEFHIGAGAAAAPGFVPGLFAVHGDLGRLPMQRVAEPAIRVAGEGVGIESMQAYIYSVVAPILVATEPARALFTPNGALPQPGDVLTNPDLGETLRALAAEGPGYFVDGAAGQAMLAQCERYGGHLGIDDLRDYRVARREPLTWTHRGHRLSLNPAPAASGPLIALALAFAEAETASPDAAELARIMQRVNAARPGLMPILREDAAPAVIADQIAELAGRKPAYHGTTHISVLDEEGNAASVSISNGEGNGHIVEGCGFMLNNMLGEEDLLTDGFHGWTPDRRLSSMMAPTIIETPEGGLTALGTGGSNRIRTAVFQVALNLIDRGMALDEAVVAPRIHVEKCGTVSFEDVLAPAERDALLAAFPQAHAWPDRNLFFGGVHAAARSATGALQGAGDPRRGGVSLAA